MGDCCDAVEERISTAAAEASLAALMICAVLGSVLCAADGAIMEAAEDDEAGADVATVIVSLAVWDGGAGSRWCGGGELVAALTAAGMTTCGVTLSGSDGLLSRAGEEADEATDTTDEEDVVRCWRGVGDVDGMPDIEKVEGVGEGERADSAAEASMGVEGVGEGAAVRGEVVASKRRDDEWLGGASRWPDWLLVEGCCCCC